MISEGIFVRIWICDTRKNFVVCEHNEFHKLHLVWTSHSHKDP